MTVSLRRFFNHSLLYTVSGLAARLVNYLLIPLYTRFLSPEDYGVLGVGLMLILFFSNLFSLGLPDTVMRLYVDSETDAEEKKRFTNTVLLYHGVVGCLLCGIFCWVGAFFSVELFPKIDYFPYILMSILIGLLQSLVFTIPQQIIRIRSQAGLNLFFTLIYVIANAGFSIYLIVFQRLGALGYLGGMLAALVLLGVGYGIYFWKEISLAFSRTWLQKIVAFSLPLLPQAVLFWVLSMYDRAVLQAYASLADVGVYTLAFQFASVIQVINLSADVSWKSALFRADNLEENKKLLPLMGTYYFAGLALAAWGICVFGGEFVYLFVPQAYGRTLAVLPWLSVGTFCIVLYQIWANAVLYKKKTRQLLGVTVVAVLINIVLNQVFIPVYGLQAAGVVYFAAYFLLALLVYFLAQSVYPIQHQYKRWLKVLGIAGITGWAALALPLSPWVSLSEKFLLLLVWPFGLWAAGFWPVEEKNRFKGFIKGYLYKV